MSIAEIKDIAASLDEGDRADLAGFLLDLLEGADPGALGAGSVEEALCRRKEHEAGTATSMSEAAFWQGLGRGA